MKEILGQEINRGFLSSSRTKMFSRGMARLGADFQLSSLVFYDSHSLLKMLIDAKANFACKIFMF